MKTIIIYLIWKFYLCKHLHNQSQWNPYLFGTNEYNIFKKGYTSAWIHFQLKPHLTRKYLQRKIHKSIQPKAKETPCN